MKMIVKIIALLVFALPIALTAQGTETTQDSIKKMITVAKDTVPPTGTMEKKAPEPKEVKNAETKKEEPKKKKPGKIVAPELATVSVAESRAMSKGNHPAFVVTIEDVETKEVEKLWKKYLNDLKKGKTKYDKKSGEYFTDDAQFPAISDNTIDVYSKVSSIGSNKSEIVTWIDLGGAFLNPNDFADKIPEAKNWVQNFDAEAKLFVAGEAINMQAKQVKDVEKDYDKLLKEQKKMEKDIKDCEANIILWEQELADNKTAQESFAAMPAEQLQMKEVKKAYDKLQKEQKKLEKDIAKCENTIDKSKRGLKQNAADQEVYQARIEEQKELLELKKQQEAVIKKN